MEDITQNPYYIGRKFIVRETFPYIGLNSSSINSHSITMGEIKEGTKGTIESFDKIGNVHIMRVRFENNDPFIFELRVPQIRLLGEENNV